MANIYRSVTITISDMVDCGDVTVGFNDDGNLELRQDADFILIDCSGARSLAAALIELVQP